MIRLPASPSTAPKSPSTGTRRARPWSCRSRCSRAAIASPCSHQFDAPREGKQRVGLQVSGGTVVLAAAPTDPNPVVLNRILLRPAHRSRQAAHRSRAERVRQRRPRGRAQRQPRFLRRRSAAGARHCRHAHVGCDDEAALAGLTAPKVRAWVEEHIQAARSSGWTSRPTRRGRRSSRAARLFPTTAC